MARRGSDPGVFSGPHPASQPQRGVEPLHGRPPGTRGEIIKPALARGKIVITDRYYYSSVAYQGALGLDPDQILAENEALARCPIWRHPYPASGPGAGPFIPRPSGPGR